MRLINMIKEYRDKIAEGGCTKTEVTLIGIILLLTGVIIGILISPKKIGVYGSFNGNQGSLTSADKDE
ncbi:MAG: hypothetical protein KBG42_11170 [Lachnospiraceae bacterium]|nr:hypothetical protein [Lachnospiraceae bacterium]